MWTMRETEAIPLRVTLAAAGDPFCARCGYSLKGLTESCRCPECGGAFVDVLVRHASRVRRWQSKSEFLGMPLISIASGPAPGERFGRPVGFIAVGDFPRGVIAVGGVARGVVAVGGVAMGGFSVGGLSLGVVAVGSLSIGGIALGAISVGVFTLGSLCFCVAKGWGAKVWYLLR